MKAFWWAAVSVVAVLVTGEQPARADGRFSVGISINYVDDFYEPLRTHGHWVNLRPYGRCWYPAYVGADWRPYADGHWEWTDRGWYWVSDEAWGWATYHYGRWMWDAYYGWVWVPGTEWGPAWVAWRENPDYIGWAPLPPDCDYGPDGFLMIERVRWTPRWFTFVEHRHFCAPVRPHVIVVNQTIINQTVNITKVQRVERDTVVHHSGPRLDAVEKRTGTRVQETRAEDLWRRRSEQVVERATTTRATPPPVLAPVVKPAPSTPPTVKFTPPVPEERRSARTGRETVAPTVAPSPPPAPATEPPVTTTRPRWQPPTVIRGTTPDTPPPATTEPPPTTSPERSFTGRQRWTPPPATPTVPTPAPTERPPERSYRDERGNRDERGDSHRGNHGRRDDENDGNDRRRDGATNAVPPYFRGR